MTRFKLSIGITAAAAVLAFTGTVAAEPEHRLAPARAPVAQKAPSTTTRPYIGGTDDGLSIRRKAPARAGAQVPAPGGGDAPGGKAKPFLGGSDDGSSI